jgi:hypothetical protein
MRRSAIVLTLCLCMSASYAACESKDQDQKAYLAGVTERGRALFAYDQAAWHGTDAFFALHPDTKGLAHYICKKTPSGWVVSFGKWNEAHDRFLVVYEASESGKAGKFVARKYDPPKEAKDDLPAMERAAELTIHDFAVQNRRFNTAILPAPEGKLYVYIYPGQTKENIWPLGGDVRYTVSADGKQIIEKRQLHKAILDTEVKPDSKQPAGYHTHILSDVPEDTDVLYVLTRKPSMPEHVGTKAGVYEVNVDGTIVITNK